jgi:hypothetical protein
MKKILFIISFLISVTYVFSQEESALFSDTTVKKKKQFFKKGHDPAKAALMSAILPGAGQVYNQKYWKIPIVYAGLGGFGAWLGHNAIQLKGYTNAYRHHVEGTDALASYNGYNSESQLKFKREQAKSNLDISVIALSAWYVLNIIDATVDAHLFNFDVNEDISISLHPDVQLKAGNSLNFENNFYTGVNFRLHFK